MPSHADRQSELHRLGVKVGTEGLTPAQAEKLSAILYKSRDIMAENVTQVPEARVPRHTIPLRDTKPAVQKRFRYDPAKEQSVTMTWNSAVRAQPPTLKVALTLAMAVNAELLAAVRLPSLQRSKDITPVRWVS